MGARWGAGKGPEELAAHYFFFFFLDFCCNGFLKTRRKCNSKTWLCISPPFNPLNVGEDLTSGQGK